MLTPQQHRDIPGRRVPRKAWLHLVLLAGIVTFPRCTGLTDTDALPPDVRHPEDVRTPDGAVAAYNAVLLDFVGAFDNAVLDGAFLTDEFGSNRYGAPVFGQAEGLDRRVLPDDFVPVVPATETAGSYSLLHRVRGQARETVGLLVNYAPNESPALQAHAYAVAGYAEVLLADLYCSGIPLSTVDYGGDYTLRPGSSTADVYRHALALFDSALTLAADSGRILNLARVGKGRAKLALGEYAEAARAVAEVPNGFSYRVVYGSGFTNIIGLHFSPDAVQGTAIGAAMSDLEGANGLDYRSSGDPRTRAVLRGSNFWGREIYMPTKYSPNQQVSFSPMIVADWIEARLIEAEVALDAGDGSWLAMLNTLRTDGTFTTRPNATDTTKTDTLWNAGTGGVAGLRPLEDPGTPESRVDLVFRERAFWLFLSGHRQGDLRRLVREYGRDPEDVYPSGMYPDGQGVYGTDVTVPVPDDERRTNPQYTGCSGRGA